MQNSPKSTHKSTDDESSFNLRKTWADSENGIDNQCHNQGFLSPVGVTQGTPNVTSNQHTNKGYSCEQTLIGGGQL